MHNGGVDAEDSLPELIDALRRFTDLWRSRSRQEAFNATLPVPLDSTEGWIVWHLDGGEALRAVTLVQATGVGKSGVSKALRRLEAHGIVTVTDDPSDTRATRVQLTAHGRTVAAAMHRAATKLIGRSVEEWTVAERRTLTMLLSRLTREQSDATGPSDG